MVSMNAASFDGVDVIEDLTSQFTDRGDGLNEPRKIEALIVEDSDTDFKILNRSLQLLDTFRVGVTRATGIVEALAMANSRHFDLALVDFQLGVDTGAKAIRELGGRSGEMAVVLVTGMPGQEIPHIALRAGAIQCLDKNNMTPVLLETTIRSALYTHALESRLQRMIIDLERANRAKAEFFERVGPDLKAPLHTVVGYAKMIASKSLGDAIDSKYVECAQNIDLASAHLLEVLNNFSFQSTETGEPSHSQFSTVDMNDVVSNAVVLVDAALRDRGHRISVSKSETELESNCWVSAITQAVVNVLSNAIKFTPIGGAISISATRNGRWNEITVRDNGIGMSQNDISVALLPFGRVDLPPELAQDGIGIGLPVVRDILRAHGGQLEIDSSEEGGTTVVLRLPPAMFENEDAA